MGESPHFDNTVGSGAYEHTPYPMFDDEESEALFRAFTVNSDWESVSPESSSSKSTSSLRSSQTLEEGVVSTPAPQPHSQLSSTSSTPARRATNTKTGAQATPSTPATSVLPTPSDVSPSDVATPLTPSVDLVEAYLAFTTALPGSARVSYNFGSGYTTSPLGPPCTSQIDYSHMVQAPDYFCNGAAPVSLPQQYAMECMATSSYPWGFTPVPQQQPLPTWSLVPQSSPFAMAPAPHQAPIHVSHASASAMNPPIPAPGVSKRKFEFADPVVPTGFKPNPDNHARFEYKNGRRIYLNSREGKKLRTGAV